MRSSLARSTHFCLALVLALAHVDRVDAGGMTAKPGQSHPLQINKECVETGCFPGDSPGLPVTISSPGNQAVGPPGLEPGVMGRNSF